jgi:hypothetical protein
MIMNDKVKYDYLKDGFIVLAMTKLFDILRQISVFEQIRNISRWRFSVGYRRNSPEATRNEIKQAWKESNLFVSSYLFPEIWVVGHLLLGIVCYILVSQVDMKGWDWVLCAYALLHSFEILIYQLNVLLFDPIRNNTANYKIKSATRTIILLLINMMEYIIWFAVVYLGCYDLYGLITPNCSMILESFLTLSNIADPRDVHEPVVMVFASIESVIGLFMNILCLARFIAMIPPVQTIDKQ